MANLIVINGDTSQQFVAENVSSLQKRIDGAGNYDIIVSLGADKRYFSFLDETSRDSAFDSISSIIGTITDITP